MCTKTWLAIAKSDQDRDMGQASQVYRTARVGKLAWIGVVMSLSGREGPFLTRPSAVLAIGGLWDATVLVDESGYLWDVRCSNIVLIERLG